MDQGATWIKGAGAGRRDVRVLFTSAGRRVELLQAFTRAARSLGLKPHWHASDMEAHFAAGHLAEKTHLTPRADAPEYIPKLLQLVRREKIDLLVSLIDSDLLKLADARSEFARIGCGVVISSPEVVRNCRDKFRTFTFLKEHGFDTPQTWTPKEILALKRRHFPYFLKPCGGSASKGTHLVRDLKHLKALLQVSQEPMIQEFVGGVEYTLDVFAGYDGRPRCVVPRQRLEVRGGEVTKARTVKHAKIMETGARVVEALAGCVGMITIQVILSPDGRIRVIEINPRFGGGSPLGIQAGANSPKWLLAEWMGKDVRIRMDQFQDGLLMLRYHQAFFIEEREEKSKRRNEEGEARGCRRGDLETR